MPALTRFRSASRRNVLLLYTGGTFGMEIPPGTGAPIVIPKLSPSALRSRLQERVPELAAIADCEIRILLNRDSAHVGPAEWKHIADEIRKHWKRYDGVVLLHGTDTLSYTASALSFLLRPCLRPVVITGAQRPLTALRTDARRNLISAVEIAAHGPRALVSQVLVFFDDRLLVGNRARKRSASEFSAFESPKTEPLALVGTEIRYRSGKSPSGGGPRLNPEFSRRVALLHVTPGAPYDAMSGTWLDSLEGLVLVAYPSGTGPSHDEGFKKFLHEARERELPVVVVTEGHNSGLSRAGAGTRARGGEGSGTYEAGRLYAQEGCYFAGEMTPECAYVKASLILGQKTGRRRFKELWAQKLAGEG